MPKWVMGIHRTVQNGLASYVPLMMMMIFLYLSHSGEISNFFILYCNNQEKTTLMPSYDI